MLAPCTVVLAIAVILGAAEGGFFATAWLPAGLFVLAVVALTAVVLGLPRGVPRMTWAAVGLFAAYTAWTYLSITWADQQGLAWDGANRTALYLLVLALFALWPLRTRAGVVLLGLLGLGIALLGLVELLRIDASASPEGFMVDARLAEPVGYINANVAIWALGTWPCLFLAARREVPAVLRGIFLGSAGLLASLALLGQSRSWLVAVPIAALLYVALVPNRLRATAALAMVATATFAISGPLLAVHDDASDGSLVVLVEVASERILAIVALLAVLGLAWGLIDRRVSISPTQALAARRSSAAIAAAIALIALVAAIAGGGATSAAERWDDFKQGGEAPYAGSSRLSSSQTNRYDFWTVAFDLFKEQPIRGIGVENFQAEYLKRGESGEQPRFPHSLELSVVSQTGIVGALLLLGAFAAALASAFQRRDRWQPLAAGVRAAAVATFAYFILHASVDWLWEFPALAMAAFAMLGLAMSIGRPPPEAADSSRKRKLTTAALVALAVLALGASLAFPWLAALETREASGGWRSDPAAALDRLDRAGGLNPLSPTPALTAGTIALEIDDRARARAEFRRALERDPENFYATLELGAIAAKQGNRRKGLRLLERASRLNPLNDIVREAIDRVQAGERLDVEELNQAILLRARERAR